MVLNSPLHWCRPAAHRRAGQPCQSRTGPGAAGPMSPQAAAVRETVGRSGTLAAGTAARGPGWQDRHKVEREARRGGVRLGFDPMTLIVCMDPKRWKFQCLPTFQEVYRTSHKAATQVNSFGRVLSTCHGQIVVTPQPCRVCMNAGLGGWADLPKGPADLLFIGSTTCFLLKKLLPWREFTIFLAS